MKRFLKSSLSLILAITIIFSSAYVGFGEVDFNGHFSVEAEAAVDSDIVEFNGHYYKYFSITMKWHDAKAYCESLGGHLVTITSIDENDFVKSICPTLIILGLTDEVTEGDWQWVTGEQYDFSNFDPGEPNNQFNEDYAYISNTSHGRWGDGHCERELWAFVCEWDDNYSANHGGKVELNGHYYEIFDDSMSWSEAKTVCEKLGGHLVTITSQEEQSFIGTLVNLGAKKSYWLGGQYRGGVWCWITDEDFSYSNWYPGEPNNSGNFMQIFSVRTNYNSISNGWDNTRDTGDAGGGIKYSEIGFICEWDEFSGIDESFVMQAGMPKLSHQDAVNFLSFLYNQKDGFKGVDITSDVQYQLLTGNLPEDMTVDEIKGLIAAFLCMVDRLTNAQIEEYQYKTDYLHSILIERLEKEVGGMSNLDEQIINQEMGKISKYVENGLVEIGTGIISRTTGIVFTEKVFDDIGNVLSGISKTIDVASKIEDMYNYTIDGVLLYGVALGQEDVARVSYFNSYLGLRDLNETAFRGGIDCAFDTLAMSSPLSKLLDLLTWFTRKDSWTNHRADIERWAEYTYQLGQYQKQDFHRYNRTVYPETCTTDGYTLCECIYCDETFTENIVKATGHKYVKTVVAPLCEEQGYDFYKCKACGDSYKDNYINSLGHSLYKKDVVVPTCTEGGYTLNYCKCGYEWLSDEKSALQHNYIITVVDPTETKQGYALNECSNCGDVYHGNYVNPTGHDYTVTQTQATCEQDGVITHTCDCGESYLETISAKGHNYVLDSFTLPSCTKTGLKTYKCRNCDDTYAETIAELKHDYSYKEELIEPSCSEQGYTKKYCECGDTIITDYLDATGHSYEITETVDATCISDGYVKSECSVCGNVITEVESSFGGHDFILIESSELTCTSSQYDLYECSVCTTQKYENVIYSDGHTYETCETINPTCETEGSCSFFCSTCKQNVTEILPVVKHTIGEWEYAHSGVENEMIRKCTVCETIVEKSTQIRTITWHINGKTLTDYLPAGTAIAPPLTVRNDGYEFSYWYPETPPLAIGDKNLTFTAVYSNDTGTMYVIDDFSYTYDSETHTATICGYLGTDEQVLLPEKILDCDVTGIAGNAIPAKVTQVTVPRTVTDIYPNSFNSATGLQKINVDENNAVYTDINGVLYSKDETELVRLPIAYQGNFEFAENITTISECAFNGHKLSEEFNIPETITTIEKSAFSKCTGIKYVFYTDTEEEWSKISIGSDNACLTNAYVHYETTEHIYSDEWTVDVAPTCTKVGSKSHKCNFCDSKIEVTEVPATGHSYSTKWTVDLAPTCTKDGSKSHHCIVCDDKADITSIDALGHDYSTEWTIDIAVTCTTDGSKSRHCANCGSKTDITVIPATGHSYSIEWTVDTKATCTADGSKSHHCINCGGKTDVTVIPSKGHSYSNEWTIDLEPTCTEEGSKSYHCTGCDEKIDITIIEAKGHSYSNDYCVNCGLSDIWTFSIYDDYASVTKYKGSATEVVVPSYVAGVPITTIAYNCFYNNSTIVSVTIPEGVNTIALDAFRNCTNLKSVVISKSLTSVSNYAFYSCDALRYVFYGGSESEWSNITLGTNNNPLTNAIIHYDSTDHTFKESISYPTCAVEGVVHNECTICGFYIDESIPMLEHDYSDEWTIDFAPTCIKNGSKSRHCTKCDSKTDEIVILSLGHSYGNAVIEREPTCTKTGSRYKVCSACNRKSTEVIPALGHSFSEEWTIDIPATCTTTGQKSHHCTDCDAKTDFTVIDATGHNYVTTVEPTHPHTTTKKCSFCNDEHTEVPYVSNCVECNFTVAALDANSYKLVSYIGTGANVVVPTEYNGLLITKIEANCFKGNTTIKSVVIPEGITSMGNAVFYGCTNLESVTIPSTVTNTGNAAFYNCTSLKFVKIADGVKSIGNSVFRGCTSLESITIPESVTTIGAQAFYGFTGTIYCTKDSTAHNYAVANNIKFEFIEDVPITANEHSQIDYDKFIIKTTVHSCTDITNILGVSDSARIVVTASCKQGSIELLGTGTVISVHEGDTLIGDYTLVVNGDTDGDSICDALDCFDVERASNGNANLSGAYAMAADSNADDLIDITDYQAIVNKALAS